MLLTALAAYLLGSVNSAIIVTKLTAKEDIRSYGFRVVNNGPAIDPEVLPRIFNTGFTTKAAGHGLGLSIVKELVEDCGGEIAVESAPGRTAFAGTLPKGEIREEESK